MKRDLLTAELSSQSMRIIMQEQEISLLTAFLSETENYFEFGIGGSTYLASKHVRGDICGVESDASWVEKVRQETSDNPRVHLTHVDIGPTGDWGFPTGNAHQDRFGNYSAAIVASGRKDFDLCLVDGRFRVACFLQALIYLNSDAIIGIHDYTDRPQYHLIEKFARPIAGTHQLKFFQRRLAIDEAEVLHELDTYRVNPA